jgi:hypothetical protein
MFVSQVSIVGLNFISNWAYCPAETRIKSGQYPDLATFRQLFNSMVYQLKATSSLYSEKFRHRGFVSESGCPASQPVDGKMVAAQGFSELAFVILSNEACLKSCWYTILSAFENSSSRAILVSRDNKRREFID